MQTTWEESLKKFNSELSLERAKTIPSAWYWEPRIYALEREHVFGSFWSWAGRVSELKSPGDYVCRNIAGEPIVVLRDQRGELRAFSNVCRHRAAIILHKDSGNASKLRCPYHSWTYDLQGQLIGAPEFDGVKEFCREKNGLKSFDVESWGPWVFVRLGEGSSSLSEQLGSLGERTAKFELDSLEFYQEKSYVLDCNWKVFIDNYLDGGYHVNSIHPALGGVIDYKDYQTINDRFTSLQISPLKADEDGVSTVRTGTEAQYWWIFPNLMINFYQGVMDLNVILPLSESKSLVLFEFYFHPSISDEFRKQSVEVANTVQLEDMDICSRVQEGLGSRFYDTGRFSVRRESGGYHFHKLLASQLQN